LSQEKPIAENKKSRKWIFIPAAFILLFAIYMLAMNVISSMAERELVNAANREIGPNSELLIGNLKLRLFPVSLTLRDVRLNHLEPFEETVPEKPLDTIRYFHINRAELRGIRLFRLLRGDDWGIRNLTIDGLEAGRVPTTGRRLADADPFEAPLNFTIDEFSLNNAAFSLYPDRSSNEYTTRVEQISMTLSEIEVKDAEEPLHRYFNTFRFHAGSVRHFTDNGFYKIEISGLNASGLSESVLVDRFEMKPLLTPYDAASQSGHALDLFDIKSGPIEIRSFDFDSWFAGGDLILSYAELDSLAIIIDRDLTYARPERDHQPLPQMKLAGLPFTVFADSLRWKNGFLSYTEKFYEKDRAGTISFEQIDLTITDLQNSNVDEPIMAKAAAKFMDSADLDAEFEFYPAESGLHRVKASLGAMDFNVLNETLENLALVKVESGSLTSLEFSFEADDDVSSGDMKFIYENLELRFLDDDTMDERFRNRILSFLANTLAIRSSNDGEEPRPGKMDYERDKDRSMFNFWWRSIESGIKDTVIR
jgi:hypothetical protein